MIRVEDIYYLEIIDVFDLYARIFSCTTQQAADQLRNRDGLESALARPANYAMYYDADIGQQTAVLIHGIAEGQHFIEGNKRTAYLAGITFLGVNGYHLTAPQREVADWIQSLALDLTLDDLARNLREVLQQTPNQS